MKKSKTKVSKKSVSPKWWSKFNKPWIVIVVFLFVLTALEFFFYNRPGTIFWNLFTWRFSLIPWVICFMTFSVGMMIMGSMLLMRPATKYPYVEKAMYLLLIVGGVVLLFESLTSARGLVTELLHGPHQYSGPCKVRYSVNAGGGGSYLPRRRVEYDVLIDSYHELIEISKQDYINLVGAASLPQGFFSETKTVPCNYNVKLTYIKVRNIALSVQPIGSSKLKWPVIYYK